MRFKEYLTTWLPLFLVISFFYYTFQSAFGVFPGNVFLAMAICIVIFKELSWDTYVFLFLLGWISGMDANVEFLSALFFVGIGVVFSKWRHYLKLNTFKVKAIWCTATVGIYLIFRLVVYFYLLDVDSGLSLKLWLNLFASSSFYFLSTLFDAFILYWIIKGLVPRYD